MTAEPAQEKAGLLQERHRALEKELRERLRRASQRHMGAR